MNDPSELFKVLAPHQEKNSPEKSPSKYAAEYADELFKITPKSYSSLVRTAKAIDKHSKNKKEDITTFIKGSVLAKAYDLDIYTSCIEAIAENPLVNISLAIDVWLEDRFRTHHPELFQKLNLLDYTNHNTEFEIFNTKNPEEIQKYLQKTFICICDSPSNYFKNITNDAGTLHILAIQRDQKDKINEMKRGEPNIGHVILNAYHGIDQKETLLAVDSVWINNNNKGLLCSLLKTLSDLSDYLDLSVIDKTMSTNYLLKNGHTLDIYDQKQSIYKLGRTPQFSRYNPLMASAKTDSGFYILKAMKKCNEKTE